MNESSYRELLAQVIIVVAICAGGWFMFVQPRESEAKRLEEQIKSLGGDVLSPENGPLAKTLTEVAGLRGQLATVQAASMVARDPSQTYDLITRLARDCQLKVRSVSPLSLGDADDREQKILAKRTEILVDGEYEALVRFVGAFTREAPASRIVLMTVSPLSNTTTPAVSAMITVDTFSFVIPEGLKNLVSASQSSQPESARAE